MQDIQSEAIEEVVEEAIDLTEASQHFEKFMESLGLDTDDEHMEETPMRVARSRYRELFRGLSEDPREHLAKTFSDGVCDEFVIVGPIQVQSMCAHHFLPFTGVAHVGYIPSNEVVGLSKLARVTKGYSRRPQVQERLTNQIADAIQEELDPVATVVYIDAEHECMTLRGVEEPASMTKTTALRGEATEDESIKQEFFQTIDQ